MGGVLSFGAIGLYGTTDQVSGGSSPVCDVKVALNERMVNFAAKVHCDMGVAMFKHAWDSHSSDQADGALEVVSAFNVICQFPYYKNKATGGLPSVSRCV